MAGIGDTWGTREEMLHPRGKNGRFISKLKVLPGIVDMLQRIKDAFRPRTFQSDQQAAQYAHNIAKPSRFGGGTQLPRFKADFDNVQEDLRDGIIDEPSTKRYVAMMDASMVELPDDVILSRQLGPDAFGLTPEQMDADSGGIRDWQGSRIADRGYASTTLGTPHPAPAGQGHVTMVIMAPKGTKAVPVGDGLNDREIILDRDQDYHVTKVSPDGRGGFYMYAVATPRTEGATPAPVSGHVGPGRPQNREAAIKARSETARKRLGVTPDLTQQEQQQPLAPGGMVPEPAAPAAPRAPGVPPQGEAPAARKARRQQLLSGGSPTQPPAPASPQGAPSTPPAPTPEVPGGAPQVDFRAAVREAQLPAPSQGKRRAQWNNAYLGVVSGKKHPEDAVRELDSDITYWNHVLADDKASGTDSGPLSDDVTALEALRDLIKEKYGLGGQQQKPAPEAAAPTPIPSAPEVPKKVAPKAAVPKKAPGGPREVAPPVSREGRVPVGRGHATVVKKEAGQPREVAAPASREGRVQVGKQSHAVAVKREPGVPREVAPPVSRAGREQLGGQSHFVPAKVAKPEKVAAKKAVPSKTTAPTTKAAREEEQQQMDTLRETIAKLPEGSPTRDRSQKLLDQMESDHQDDQLVTDWLSGSGVREPSLTEAERAHLGRVAHEIRTGKLSDAEAGRDLRSQGSEKLDKIARRVEGGEKLKTPRKPKAEPIDELDGKTVPELKAVAKAEGIKGYSKLNRDPLKEAIRKKRSGGTPEVKAPETADELRTRAQEILSSDTGPETAQTLARRREAQQLIRRADRMDATTKAAAKKAAPAKKAESPAPVRRAAAKKTAPAKKATPRIAIVPLTPDQKRDVSDLSPVEQREYRSLRRAGNNHADALQGAQDLAGTRGATEAAKANKNLEATARERQAQIDSIRGTADLTSELDELIANEAEPAVMRHRITASAKRLKVPDAVRDQLLRAIDTNDPNEMRRTIGVIHGGDIRPVGGTAGHVSKFDRTTQRAIGSPLKDGERVRTVRPGREATLPDGKKVQLSKAVVEAEPEAPKPKEALTARREQRLGIRARREQALESLRAQGIDNPSSTVLEEQMRSLADIEQRDLIRARSGGAVPPKETAADRVTSHLMARITRNDPAMAERIMADMKPADRELVRESIQRAGGKVPPVTDAEAEKIMSQLPADIQEGFKRASADDLRQQAKDRGLKAPKGDTKDEISRDLFKQRLQQELDARVAAKAAKAAPKKASAPRPTGAHEGLDVKEIGKGLDLGLIPQGYLDGAQKDLDEGKKTPAAIGRELHQMAHGPMGPGTRMTVLRGVSGANTSDRLRDALKQPPSPERDAEVARLQAHLREIDDEAAGLQRQMEEMDKLAERLKVTRRKRATAPKPEAPTLTPKEEAKAAEVADLAGVPEARVQARIKAQKAVAAPVSDAGRHVADLLGATSSREEAAALLKGKTRLDLIDIAKATGTPHTARATKPQIESAILDGVGLRSGRRVRPAGVKVTPTKLPPVERGTQESGIRLLAQGGFREEKAATPSFPVPKLTAQERRELAKAERENAARNRLLNPAATPTKAAAPSITGPLQRKRPPFDAGVDNKPLERPNADEPIHLDRMQMSGAGNMHGDSEMGQLWDDLYRDDRTPNSTLNRIAELARSMAYGDRNFDEIMRELRRLEADAPDPNVKDRIRRAIERIDTPQVALPKLPEGTPKPLVEAIRKLAEIPTARKAGSVGHRTLDQSILDTKVDVIRRLANGELSPYDIRTELGKHDLHESTDGAVQMWAIFDRLINEHGEELRKWAQAARRKASQ